MDDQLVIKRDCTHFRGDLPCKPHKEYGVHCENCDHYIKRNGKILIIKLGAIGDVIRTTPLIHKIRKEFPSYDIWWLTYTPDVVPSQVDKVLGFDLESILLLEETSFNVVINLDKDTQACALTKRIKSDEKHGYTLMDGKPAPLNSKAIHKFHTGLFDDISQNNTKSYLEEIFEIAGWEFSGEEYIIDVDKSIVWNIPNNGKKIIGLNTGCGARWVSRLWADENWIKLIKDLENNGFFPLLLGGKQEDEKNTFFSSETGAHYLGYYSLKEFISLIDQCDLVVSAVTMGMHITTALKKPLVLMNNIFNPYEFELYGRGEIVQPVKPCTCYFSPKCKNTDYFCMDHLSPESILEAVKRQII